MIHFIVGKPRAGKTLWTFYKLVDELRHSKSFIVTNLVIDLDGLQRVLDAEGRCVHVRDRVRMITDEELGEFFLIRKHQVLEKPADYNDKKGSDLSYTPLIQDSRFGTVGEDGKVFLDGTVYVIDEIHTRWPARGWQELSRHLMFYLTQHGKLGDTVYLITQNTKLCDTNLIRVAQDFTYCDNYRIKKYGMFRGGDYFVASTYPSPVQDGQGVTLERVKYKLIPELANCYDTSAGVGMPGGTRADAAKARVKGFGWSWLIGAGALAAILIFFLGWALLKKSYQWFGMDGVSPRIAQQRQEVEVRHDEPLPQVVQDVVPVKRVEYGPELSCLAVIDGKVLAKFGSGQWVEPSQIDRANARDGYLILSNGLRCQVRRPVTAVARDAAQGQCSTWNTSNLAQGR